MTRLALIVTLFFLAAMPAGAAERLTVLLDWFVNPDHAALVIAKERGMFEEAGLDVSLVPPADPSAPPRLVAAGQAYLLGRSNQTSTGRFSFNGQTGIKAANAARRGVCTATVTCPPR